MTRLFSWRAIGSCVVATLLLLACGSRGPLDDEPVVAPEDAAAPDVRTTPDADVPDASIPPEAGIASCAACVFTTCSPRILTCFESPACRAVFQCIVTTCLGGGGIQSSCLLGCGARDPAGALQVLGILQCLTGDCASTCGPLLGNLGGFGSVGGRR
jgi:hypothetical protein